MTITEITVWSGDDVNRINEAKEEWLAAWRATPGWEVARIEGERYVKPEFRADLIDRYVHDVENSVFGLFDNLAICLTNPEFTAHARYVSQPMRPWKLDFVRQLVEGLDRLDLEVRLGVACYRGVSEELEELLREFEGFGCSEYWIKREPVGEVADLIEELFGGRFDATHGLFQGEIPWRVVTERLRAYLVLARDGVEAAQESGLIKIKRQLPLLHWVAQAESRPAVVWERAFVALAESRDLQRFAEGPNAVTNRSFTDHLRLVMLSRVIRRES